MTAIVRAGGVGLTLALGSCLPSIAGKWLGPVPVPVTTSTGDTGAAPPPDTTPVQPLPIELVATAGWLGEGSNHRFGTLVANLGDIDGDGEADLGVSAPKQDRGLEDLDYVFTLDGQLSGGGLADPSEDAYSVITGPKAGLRQGQFLTAVRDSGGALLALGIGSSHVGGDGDDTDIGAVYFVDAPLPAAVSLPSVEAFVPGGGITLWVGDGPDGYLGHSLIVAEESGLIVASAPAVVQTSRPAEVFVLPPFLDGQLHPISDALVSLQAEAVGDDAGRGLAIADIDGDGLDDLMVGAPAVGPDLVGDDGVAYVVLGPLVSGSLGDAPVRLSGTDDSLLGIGMHTADVDNDGLRDVIVSALTGWYVVSGATVGAGLSSGIRPASYLEIEPLVGSARRDEVCDEAVGVDVDRDTHLDLILSDCSTEALAGGAVYVLASVDGLSGTLSLADAALALGSGGDRTGCSVAVIERGDGVWIAVGAEQYDFAGSVDLGAAFLLDGELL